MKVLNVTVLLDPVFGGGTAERTYQMSKALVLAGANCTILTTDVGLSEERIAGLAGVKVVALHSILKRFFIVQFSWAELKKLVASVDVVHLMGHWSMLNVLVYFIARQTNTPYVVCPAGELPVFGRSRWIKRLFNLVIGNRILREASGYIAVTADEIPAYVAYGIKAEFVTVIPNGVNENDFKVDASGAFRHQFNIKKNPFILFMGRLNLIKGPDMLLEAFCLVAKKFPTYHLVFAGPDGGLLSSLKKRAKASEINNRVHFIGYVAGKDKINAYREADFLVIPSRQEAMSIVVLEAGASGTPVLLTDQCGFNEVGAVDGGVVVKALVGDLAAGLEIMMNKEAKLIEMGNQLRCFVQNNFTWNLISERYLALYNQIAIRKMN
jgi:glycosyltransferase involved in cell wall biosynthesis